MAAEVMTGLSIFSSMMNIAKTLKDIDNAVNRNAAVIELQSQIFSAQATQTTLIARVGELEADVRRFENWERETLRYELHEISGGKFVYRLKDGMEPAEPAHQICAKCYQLRKKSILQTERKHKERGGIMEFLVCHECGS
jgi:hypothetical protein